MGLDIGAAATVFSVIDGLLLRQLPFVNPKELVWITNKADSEGNMSARTVQVIPMLAFRERNKSFTDIAGYFAFYGIGDFCPHRPR